MTRRTSFVAAGLVLLVLATAAIFWYLRQQPEALPELPPAEPAAAVPAAPPTAPVAAAPASAPIEHPIEAVAAEASGAAEAGGLEDMLIALFGRKAVVSRLQLDDFAHRVVATVDNLPRERAATRLWPVNPAEGRFTVQQAKGEDVVDPDNGQRYAPYVAMLEAVDLRQAALVYKRLYPELQSAYQELGYPNGYFNDRLVQVVDHLLAAPEPEGLLHVRLPEFKGTVQPARPWVLYEYTDPALESLSSGQKIMVRMGTVNERRVKARLREWRRIIAAARPAAPAASTP
ncbi:MAG: DUF3014 domain-containing protein [Rhizobacter sp.]|nr:DUF3014 domain-containing protein [Rhizobacter sp.]